MNRIYSKEFVLFCFDQCFIVLVKARSHSRKLRNEITDLKKKKKEITDLLNLLRPKMSFEGHR